MAIKVSGAYRKNVIDFYIYVHSEGVSVFVQFRPDGSEFIIFTKLHSITYSNLQGPKRIFTVYEDHNLYKEINNKLNIWYSSKDKNISLMLEGIIKEYITIIIKEYENRNSGG